MRNKQRSYNCTDAHEDYINEYASKGFVKNQFSFFVRYCILAQFAKQHEITINLNDIYNSIIEKNKISTGACQSYCYKLESALTKLICERNRVIYCEDHDENNDISECSDCEISSISADWLNDCVYLDNLRSWYNKNFNVLPDCWRFENGVIQAVEITDTHAVSFDKLEKFAYIDDLLYQNTTDDYNKDYDYIHIDLIEQQSTTGLKFVHNIHYVFGIIFDWPLYPEFKSDVDRMRHYYRQEGIARLYGPDLPDVCIADTTVL